MTKLEIIEYEDRHEEDYIRVHNEGFSGRDSAYTRNVDGYNEEGRIVKTFLAVKIGKIIGFLDVINGDSIEIYPVGVLPSHRNRGIGTKLLRHAVQWCENEGFKKVRALTSAGAEKRLHQFFSRNGFRRVSHIYATKDGKVEEIELDEGIPVNRENLKGHVYVYEYLT